MFAFPYLLGILGRNSLQTRLVDLLKQFKGHASLALNAFTLVEEPSSVSSWTVENWENFHKELIFSQNEVDVFIIKPVPTFADHFLQKFNRVLSSEDHRWPTHDKNQIHFVVEAISHEQINEKEIKNLIRPTAFLNNVEIGVKAWMASQLRLILLGSCTIEKYATIGSALISKTLEPFFQFHVQRMYSVKYGTSNRTGKPPNVLIYTGDNDLSSKNFVTAKGMLGQCLDQNKYVIYQLQHQHIMTQPWQENASLLVITTDQKIEVPLKNVLDNYVQGGGRLISFGSQYTLGAIIKPSDLKNIKSQHISVCENVHSSVEVLDLDCVDAMFEVEKSDQVDTIAVSSSGSRPLIVSVSYGTGIALLSLANLFADKPGTSSADGGRRKQLLKDLLSYIGLTCSDMRQSVLTTAHLLGHKQKMKMFLESIEDLLVDGCFKGNKINLVFSSQATSKAVAPSRDCLPVIAASSDDDRVSFSFPSYQEHLNAKRLGQLVIYSEIVTSTQTIVNGCLNLVQKLPDEYRPVVVGRQQILGKGRGGNDWLSPDGCLSFSFPLQVDLDSCLGRRLPFLQHMAALAVTEAVRSMNDYEDVEIRIKWPNDIYFGRDVKIGGILVNSSIQGKLLNAVVGIGINLDNSEPTTCINDILERENHLHGKNLGKLSREQLLARILNTMERLLEDFQQHGPEDFLTKYYTRWLHSGVRVALEGHGGEHVTVRGLDDMGFLSAVSTSNDVISVQPDGNSFDMMRNLIAIKTQK